jgi:hypothetical protein
MTFEAFEQEVSDRMSALPGVAGRVIVGPPADELLGFADEVDLLVASLAGLARCGLKSTEPFGSPAQCPAVEMGVMPSVRDGAGGP